MLCGFRSRALLVTEGCGVSASKPGALGTGGGARPAPPHPHAGPAPQAKDPAWSGRLAAFLHPTPHPTPDTHSLLCVQAPGRPCGLGDCSLGPRKQILLLTCGQGPGS